MMDARRVRGVGAVALLAVAGVGACGDDDDEEEPQLPNPASVYCEEQGGTVDLVEEPGGVVGYCELPDGRRVEEWELYRSSTTGG